MGQRLVIEIKINRRIMGNCYYHWEGFTIAGLSRVKQIIDNYNKYLVGAKLPDELLVLRMFQETDPNGTLNSLKPILEEQSKKFIQDLYPSYDIVGMGEEDHTVGRIALTNGDMEVNLGNRESRILIDLDNKTIETEELIYSIDLEEYLEYSGETEENNSLKKAPDELNLWNFKFYQLDEAIEFVLENINGWKDPFVDDVVYTPID